MASGERQARFEEGFRHFPLQPKGYDRKTRTIPPGKKGPIRFPHTSRVGYDTLQRQAKQIRDRSAGKQSVYDDLRLYFKVTFSDAITNWRSIEETLLGLHGNLVDVVDEFTVKLGVNRSKFVDFLRAVDRGKRYIANISETSIEEVVEPALARKIKEQPDETVHVTIELGDRSGFSDLMNLENSVKDYLAREKLGEISRSYFAERLAIYDANIKGEAVRVLAQSLGTVERIQLVPDVTLDSRQLFESAMRESSSQTELESGRAHAFPVVCTIDTGVNQQHSLLKDNVRDTFDYSTQGQYPCNDIDGHGSMVAGLIVYGRNILPSLQPRCQVIMVKGFLNRRSPISSDVLAMINRSVALYFPTAKVFSFSFGADGPNTTLTRGLDHLIYDKEVIVIACSGNIKMQFLQSHARKSDSFPSYLFQHTIYFPGDCQNAVTVGSYAASQSNWVRANSPSPFTLPGTDSSRIKPDLLEDGGNVNFSINNGSADLSWEGIGVKSTGKSGDGVSEEVGTSYSTPKVASLAASIAERYSEPSPFLVKAILISSCTSLSDQNGNFDSLIQGFGVPTEFNAMNSSSSRVSYLLKGQFSGVGKEQYHGTSFLFPDDADRLTLTFVLGRPLDSDGYLTFKLKPPGVKWGSGSRRSIGLGSGDGRRKIKTTYKETQSIKHGGKGVWWLQVIPHHDKALGSDRSLKYGCVVTVESTKKREIYRQISRWARSSPTPAPMEEEPTVSLQAISKRSARKS